MNSKEPIFRITLEAARRNASLTQSEMADKMGLSRSTINNWEKGKVIPGIPEIDMISKITGIPVDYIFLPIHSTKSRTATKKAG